MIKNFKAIILVFVLFCIVPLSGCIGSSSPAVNTNTYSTNALVVYSNADLAGAMSNLAAGFKALHPGVTISIINGSDNASIAGMVTGQTAAGQVSICAVSSPPTNGEYVSAQSQGVDLHMTEMGIDSISVFVNSSNNISDLNTSQLDDIFYTGRIGNWSQLNSSNNDSINVYMPEDPDVVQQFASTVDSQNSPAIGMAKNNTSLAVMSDPDGIGYAEKPLVGPDVKVLNLNGLSSRWGNYPLSYQLYIITNGMPSGLSLDFINYVLSHAGQEVIHGSGLTALDPTV
jgi:phosphate transport system substrate-binding protein